MPEFSFTTTVYTAAFPPDREWWTEIVWGIFWTAEMEFDIW